MPDRYLVIKIIIAKAHLTTRKEARVSFDYNAIRDKKQSGGTQWAAYSDLFMVLAFIFLLMYMVASLRAGMVSVTAHANVEETKLQIERYESIKNQYLEEANNQEHNTYQDILNHISLLENEASENKERLTKEITETRIRETSLNNYQKMLVTMMNANVIAKSNASRKITAEKIRSKELLEEVNRQKTELFLLADRLALEKDEISSLKNTRSKEKQHLKKQHRDLKIKSKEYKVSIALLEDALKSEISEKTALKSDHEQLTSKLQRELQKSKGRLVEGQEKLVLLENQLRNEEFEMNSLRNTHSREKRNLREESRGLADRYHDSQQNLATLESKLLQEAYEMDALKEVHADEASNLKVKFYALKERHDKSMSNLASLEDKLLKEANENSDLEYAYAADTRNLRREIQNLQEKDSDNLERLSSLENNLARKEAEKSDLKASYADASKAMNAKLKRLKGKHAENQKELASLYDKNRDKLAKLNSDLDKVNKDLLDTENILNKTKGDLADRSLDLAKALAMEDRRKDIAKRIKDFFNDNGIVADVNGNTGDVYLDFGDNYFETDSHQLKPGMKQTVRKAIPIYAQSLFGSAMLSPLISSVEIIGFASPTYAGKPIDPTILSEKNRIAVNYNLDLSYRRARAIFEYVFDTNIMKFKYQEKMVHLINVAGRSFFSAEVDPKDTGNLSIDQFCGQYDCLKSQRVIIKFGLSDKGLI